ncbi:hypothetical protein T459_21537 [Capsicum annuum]|uniref:Uncharacterized protein n=1 Tax=Capsicum annuum TaxID=4072 RepID=A0A2G2YWW2_CAPAN|nr:hypothetical protein T459_21537 [Capsicum annuum]
MGEGGLGAVSSFSMLSSPMLRPSICLAGDTAAYSRTTVFGDDVLIVVAYCTAICKSKCGDFKDTLSDNLLAPVLKAVIEKTNLCSNEAGDIVVGTILAPCSIRAVECMMTAFYAGFPDITLKIMDIEESKIQEFSSLLLLSRERAGALFVWGKGNAGKGKEGRRRGCMMP